MKWNAANLYDVHLLVLYLASKYFCRRVEGDDYFPIARDSLDCLPCTTPPLPPPPPPPGKLRPKRRRFVREVKLLIRHRQYGGAAPTAAAMKAASEWMGWRGWKGATRL